MELVVVSCAAERNKEPILNVLKDYITSDGRLLEIGSGNCVHAAFIARTMPQLHWVVSDIKEKQVEIKQELKKLQCPNIHGPEVLQIGVDDFPKKPFDYVFSANTLHIMSWKNNKALFKLLGRRLREGALTFLYGPFNYNGEFTSESNKEFDQNLKQKNSKSGIRNVEDILQSMNKNGFKLLKDYQMPVNNRLLVFERLPFKKS